MARPDLVAAGDGLFSDRDLKPDNVIVTPPPTGKMKCSACGYLGGNARGCGRSHPTLESAGTARVHGAGATAPLTAITPERHLKPTPAAIAEAKERIARRDAIKARAGGGGVTPSRPEQAVDDNPTRRDRWTTSEIAVETAQAEMHKRDGASPEPSSSWQLEHDGGETGMASVHRADRDEPHELDFEGV